MKIIVLAGGLSPERNVSLVSGEIICQALREKEHQAVLVDLFLGLPEEDRVESVFNELSIIPESKVNQEQVDIGKLKQLRRDKSASIFGPNVLKVCQEADLVFLGLHGEEGENGKVQGTLESMGIKYTGSDYFGSALAMDKKISKIMMNQAGIKTPQSLTITKDQITDISQLIKHYPVVIKPSNGGSSIGVKIVQTSKEAELAIQEAFNYDKEVMIEEYVQGREFSVGFLGDQVLPAVEVIPKSGFYDFENKYQAGRTEEVCPPQISVVLHKEMQEQALKVAQILKLSIYGRVDFIVDTKGNSYCLEANSLPGMTPLSLFPLEGKAAGIEFPDLCQKIIELSL